MPTSMAMIPAGYMAKRVAKRPEWIKTERVSTIYSVSGCTSEDFADYIGFWTHNGYWLFDSPQLIADLARAHDIELTGTTLFFYEIYELQFDDGEWTRVEPDSAFRTQVIVPERKVLEGYDVVTFSAQTSPECSPLSCNGLADEVETNARCLLDSLEQARALLEAEGFSDSEPGPYRIFAVYSVDWPAALACVDE